ncbi:MAG: sulfatase-like hydrolase/transferase [Kiritimatiellae bacterium]|nr:sulfatase-like hydrolase/transferase [Kiritimatiellia bacterium]
MPLKKVTMIKNNTRPNILMICSDQHNPGITGCYGDSVVDTPALDRLAGEGVLFESAYGNCPLCVPSRLSFLTGLYPYEIECLGNDSVLDSIVPTYAHLAAIEGYHTVLSGRMHFKGPDQRHGFVERLVGEHGAYEYWHGASQLSPLKPNLGNMSTPDPLTQVGAGNTSYIDYDKAVTEATCSWLKNYKRQKPDVPFLMTVGLLSPHCPYIVSPNLFEKYKDRVVLPEVNEKYLAGLHPIHQSYRENIKIDDISRENQLKARIAYYGLTEFMDSRIGMIRETLEATGLLQNTIIVYFSDHGEMAGEHGRWHKGCFFEASIRVPLIIRMPDRSNAGRKIQEHVSLIDLFPTVSEWVHAAVPHRISGHSLVPLIGGKTLSRENRIKAEYYECDCQRMVRKNDWKFCYYSRYRDVYELYNLKEDPGELVNKAADPACRKVVKELLQEVTDDGWNDDVLKKRDERLSRYAYWEFTGKFGAAVMQDPLLKKTPDYWDGRESRNYLL